jgi:putative molybdopterin biosynthesis protein
MEKLLSTKEVAELLAVNEKMIYTLINEKGLPATKITGKWLFPKNLVEQWVESRTINYPKQTESAVEIPNLLLIAGSNDILLDSTLALFRRQNPGYIAFFGNLGSLGGLRALRQGQCHIATSHLDQDAQADASVSISGKSSEELPAMINFCRREQGLLVPAGNPERIENIADIADKGLSIANRPLDSSTRVILDRELKDAGLDCRNIAGYEREFQSHLDIGLEILAGRADTGLAIRAVATLLGLDFVPLRWERFDLLIPKNGFFAKSVQLFLDQLNSNDFRALAENFSGYDLSLSGKMIYQQDT